MTKYKLTVTMRPGATRRYIHDVCDGRRAGIMEAEVGKRGWLWYFNDCEEDLVGSPYHRLHTSFIESVVYEGKDIVITTMNTVYRLNAIGD